MICTMKIVENVFNVSSDLIVSIYREGTTDVLYIKPSGRESGFTVMLDPETGLPLTYKVWKEKYYKE